MPCCKFLTKAEPEKLFRSVYPWLSGAVVLESVMNFKSNEPLKEQNDEARAR